MLGNLKMRIAVL